MGSVAILRKPISKGKGVGWVSAEYGMLPRATSKRVLRERNQVGGRTLEIQRLIGRLLRSVVDRKLLGKERSGSTAMRCRRTEERGRLPLRAVLSLWH